MRRVAAALVAIVLVASGTGAGQPVITTVAGSGTTGFCGDGGPAPAACLARPSGLALDILGGFYIADTQNHRIRRVFPSGVITTIAGTGTAGFCGDGGQAASACLSAPEGLAFDGGNLYIADRDNHRVRRIGLHGVITTVAGNGTPGFCGDGGPATSACLNLPRGLGLDGAGYLYIADAGNHRIRRVSPAGTITTVAGDGRPEFAGEGGPATSAGVFGPAGVTPDVDGSFYIAETSSHVVRKVDTHGIITIVAGKRTVTGCIDAGLATSACLWWPRSVALDTAGNLYIADQGYNKIRKVTPAGIISTVAGTGVGSFCGDGGPATSACLYWPNTVVSSPTGAVFVADFGNDRVRKVETPLSLAPLSGPLIVGAANTLAGTGFTPGSVVKLFVATAGGTADHGPFTPSAVGATSLTWTIPAEVPLGNGFGAVQVVNSDQLFRVSNVVTALLEGNPASGIPTILFLNGVGLGPPDASIGVAHIDTVVAKGGTATIIGTAFSNPLVNLFTAAGNVGPLTPAAGGTTTQIAVTVPAAAPTGPGTFQVVNRPSFRASNAVASVIGAVPSVTSVSIAGVTVTVTGAGFSALSVINLYNQQGSAVVNLGGLGAGGARIPLTILSDTQFTFARPAGAVAGPAFVEVLNPPFIPFSSSGSDPDGAFTFP